MCIHVYIHTATFYMIRRPKILRVGSILVLHIKSANSCVRMSTFIFPFLITSFLLPITFPRLLLLPLPFLAVGLHYLLASHHFSLLKFPKKSVLLLSHMISFKVR